MHTNCYLCPTFITNFILQCAFRKVQDFLSLQLLHHSELCMPNKCVLRNSTYQGCQFYLGALTIFSKNLTVSHNKINMFTMELIKSHYRNFSSSVIKCVFCMLSTKEPPNCSTNSARQSEIVNLRASTYIKSSKDRDELTVAEESIVHVVTPNS